MDTDSNGTTIWGSEKTKDFFIDVTKAYAEHCGENEIIRTHAPSTHKGTHDLHSQIMFINREKGHPLKIKFKE